MDIRPLDAQDLPALLELYRHLHTDDVEVQPNQLEAIWAEIVSNKRITYFGGFVGNTLVSSCHITIIPNLTRGGQPYALIENVVTHTEHRGQGFGTAILQAAQAHAWSARCYKVMLLTGRKDPATLQFYASAGFDPHGKQAFIAKPAG